VARDFSGFFQGPAAALFTATERRFYAEKGIWQVVLFLKGEDFGSFDKREERGPLF
jgi:hypothetical protein